MSSTRSPTSPVVEETTGGPGRTAAESAGTAAGQRAASGKAQVRGGTASSGIPTLWLGVLVVVIFAIGVALAGGVITFGGGGAAAPSKSPAASRAAGGSPVARGTNCPTTAPAGSATSTPSLVTIETAKGTIAITVDPTSARRRPANFVALASCGFYDGVVFHRVVPGFVIQGGDPTGTGGGGPGYEIQDEPVRPRTRAARWRWPTPAPGTNGSQFFIVLADKDTSASEPNTTDLRPGHVGHGGRRCDRRDAERRRPGEPRDRPGDHGQGHRRRPHGPASDQEKEQP